MLSRKMKRLILLLAAAASVASAMPLAAPALARDGDQGGRGRAERSDGRGRGAERGEARRGQAEARGPSRREAPPRDDDEGPRYVDERPRYEERRGDGGRPNYMQGPRPNYMRPAPGSGRRGYLPDSYQGDVVENYQRYRLRPPPHGYAWVRMGNGFALVEMGSGRIFDRVD